MENNAVSHPSHYTSGQIEVKDFIMDKELNFNLGNVIKYTCRCYLKGNPVEDLEKAKQYLQFEIDNIKYKQSLKGRKQVKRTPKTYPDVPCYADYGLENQS